MTGALGFNMPRSALDREEDAALVKAREKYLVTITDQRVTGVPEDCIPGFSVAVYRKGHKHPLQSMWVATQAQAERIADEYWREVLTKELCGWK